MALTQGRRYCKDCQRKTLHARQHFSGGMGCLLTVITGGLFLLIWIPLAIAEAFNPWRCQACGRGRMI